MLDSRIPLLMLVITTLCFFILSGCTEKPLIFPPVTDAKTRGYCGSCHMAYQPSMLPAASWKKMMASLDNHFDEVVKLKPSDITHIENYLVSNAGDKPVAGKAGKIALLGLDPTSNLQRISNTPYFKLEHRFLENRILDEQVGSPANCPVCHVGAWVGDYRQ